MSKMNSFVKKLKHLMKVHGVELSMIDAAKLNAMFVRPETQEDFDIRHLLADEYKDRLNNLM